MRKLRKPRERARIVEQLRDKGVTLEDADETGRVPLHYAGNCQSPISMKSNDTTRIFVETKVRCRKCKACLSARRYHWGRRGAFETELTTKSGLRTWFGTLTASPEALAEWEQVAFETWAKDQPTGERPEWWDETVPISYYCRRRRRRVQVDAHKCDERFRLVAQVAVAEVQKYWKRLRNEGHRFSYLVVVERHKSGAPHLHFLLHEKEAPIRKRQLQAPWSRIGFSNVSIVGGKSKGAVSPEDAAWYVVKYLSKSYQSRQKASVLYGKPKVAAH